MTTENMSEQCESFRCCLFCAFANAARLHPSSLALLVPVSRAHSSDAETSRPAGPEVPFTQVELCNLEEASSTNVSPTQKCHSLSNRSSPLYASHDQVLTYAELLHLVNALSCQLNKAILNGAHLDAVHDAALEKEIKVATLMSPSLEYVVSVLAVLESGFAFVPIDANWPTQRIVDVVADSRPCLILTTKQVDIARLYGSCDSPILCVDFSSPKVSDNVNVEFEARCSCFCHSKHLRQYCYLLYTSGSTGKPKGVYGTEAGLLHRLQWMQSAYPFVASDVAVFKTSIAFVDHLTELFGPLLGNSLVIVPPAMDLFRKPLGLLPIVRAYSVSRLTAVPSLIRALLPALLSCQEDHAFSSIKVLVLSGEVLSHDLLKSLRALLPQSVILNLYGSTEVSGDCLYFDSGTLGENWNYHSVPIGKPLPSCFIKLCPINAEAEDEGELWIGGVLVALGYHNDDPSMNSKFTNIPSDTGANGDLRYFKTGDYMKKLADGTLLFLGRKDRMVKVNGQKVALDEIERNLEKHPLVAFSAVTSRIEPSSETVIVAHVVLKGKKDSSCSYTPQAVPESVTTVSNTHDHMTVSLRSWLVERLPSAMIPTHLIFFEKLPILSSGKVDHSALSLVNVVGPGTGHTDVREVEVTSLAHHIKRAFQCVLKMDNISVHDDFFSLGGTSVSAAHVAHILGIDMGLLYSHGSVIKLEPVLKLLKERAGSNSDSSLLASQMRRPFLGSRDSKRLKREDSLDFSNEAVFPHEHDTRQMGRTLKGDWPYVHTLGNPIALQRCNARLPQENLSNESKDFMHHNFLLPCSSSKGLYNLNVLWKASLGACVDASPIIIWSSCGLRLFIGSHAHKIACLNAYNGSMVWERELWGRVESTATVTSDFKQVVVGCYDGHLYFLESETGVIQWQFETKAEVKCQPMVSPHEGLIWCGSHDHFLYVLNAAKQKCVWDYDCKGSIFAAPAHDLTRGLTYVATTAGILIAFTTHGTHPEITWMHECGGPIFGSPAVDLTSGYIVCTLVNGCVIAFTASGCIAWKYNTSGPVFAGGTLTPALASQVLVCSRDGWLYSLHLTEGKCLWKYCLGEPIISAAYVDEVLSLFLRESWDGTVRFQNFRLVCVCGSSGEVHVLKVNAGSTMSSHGTISNSRTLVREWHEPGQCSDLVGSTQERETGQEIKEHELVARLKLPGDVFSSPVMLAGRIFVGCRDNNVYCLEVAGLNQ